MDDDVAAVDQNPVAIGQALNVRAAMAFFLELAKQLIGDRPDMPLGAALGDQHEVANGGLALEVDRYDVLSLCIVQNFEHDVQ